MAGERHGMCELACMNLCTRPTCFSLCLCPSKLLYRLVTIAFPPETKLLILNNSVLSTKRIILTSNENYKQNITVIACCMLLTVLLELLTTSHEVPALIPGSAVGIFPLQGKIPIATMVWVACRI
jgi:hypothetical protein